MKVINLTRVTQFPDVRHKDGKLDTIRIAPRGRVDLREGMVVDTRWMELNPDTVRIHADEKPVEAFKPIPQAVQASKESAPQPDTSADPKPDASEE